LRDHLAIGERFDAAAAVQQHDLLDSRIDLWIPDHGQERRKPCAGANQMEVAARFEIVDHEHAGRLAAGG
jgi:hypothetical protein